MAKVIETRDLAVSFGGAGEAGIVFRHLNIAVEQGEFVTLVGVSGAGKSTLLRVIADLIPPYEGSVTVETKLMVPNSAAARATATPPSGTRVCNEPTGAISQSVAKVMRPNPSAADQRVTLCVSASQKSYSRPPPMSRRGI